MLKPANMSRVVLVGTKDVLEPVIETLHRLNMVHITDYTEDDPDFKIGKPLEPASKLSSKLLTLRSISSQLGVEEKEPKIRQRVASLPSQIETKMTVLEKEVAIRHSKLQDIEGRIKEKKDLEARLSPFAVLPLRLEDYRGYDSLAVFTGISEVDVESLLKDLLKGNYEIFKAHYDGKMVSAIFVPVENENEVSEALEEDLTYQKIEVPQIEGVPRDIILNLKSEIKSLEEEKLRLEKDLEDIRKEYEDFILAWEEYLSIETQKAEAPLKFATSENTFVIDGWIPSNRYQELEREVERIGNVYLDRVEEKVEEEEVPVALENPGVVKPFELLIDTFATPRYKEIDPSFLVFISFPFFYGIMLGDIGYGILVGLLAWAIRSKFKEGGLHELANILLLSALSSVVFGVIYGEFFGLPIFNFQEHGGELHTGLLGVFGPRLFGLELPVERFGLVQSLLVFTILVGIIHIGLGLVLGFRNTMMAHGLKHAVYEKGSWMLILTGGVLTVALPLPQITRGEPLDLTPLVKMGIVLTLVGVALLVKGEGPIAVMEVPTLLSNVLSYSRLLAIGLSSAGIALAVNTLVGDLFISPGGKFLGGGILLFLVGVVILIIGHTINLILGIIGPGLHSLRLQYVEFFTKFYEGGGKKYVPFGFRRKYTEE